ncbi:MAG TPA: patatin-like phospholipase family protein, partial [Aeromonadales bacterium]|nr:patatin-like phospholipase family protein [Aeromonadales bacterium]
MAWFNKNESTEKIGLVLTGGGAKAAYQVGVIKGILEIIPNDGKNPFQVIAGASAGAINSTFMAAHANRPRIGIRRLEQAWSTLHVSRIYHVGWPGLIKNTFRWIGQFLRSSGAKRKPLSLFMNEPLREFLNGV